MNDYAYEALNASHRTHDSCESKLLGRLPKSPPKNITCSWRMRYLSQCFLTMLMYASSEPGHVRLNNLNTKKDFLLGKPTCDFCTLREYIYTWIHSAITHLFIITWLLSLLQSNLLLIRMLKYGEKSNQTGQASMTTMGPLVWWCWAKSKPAFDSNCLHCSNVLSLPLNCGKQHQVSPPFAILW